MQYWATSWLVIVLALVSGAPGTANAQPEPATEATPASATPGTSQLPIGMAPLPLLPNLCPTGLGCPPVLGAWGMNDGWNGQGGTHPEVDPYDDTGDGGARRPRIVLQSETPLWKRQLGSMTGTAGFYGALYAWAYFAWYRGQTKGKFALRWEGGFGPFTYAGGADKLGHYFSSYAIARGTAEFLRYMGWKPWVSVLVGGMMSTLWFTTIEFKDGFHQDFGFSPEDILANSLGVLTSVLMVLWPDFDRLFDVRMYYRPSKPFSDELIRKRNVDLAEDYTGSTYLLALRLMGIPWIRNTRWLRPLRFIDLMVGYNARGFLPRPSNGRWRDRELWFGFGLNLDAILEEAAPGTTTHRTLRVMQEYFQLTPVARMVRVRGYNPQPYKIQY